jgi:hypothetical protein
MIGTGSRSITELVTNDWRFVRGVAWREFMEIIRYFCKIIRDFCGGVTGGVGKNPPTLPPTTSFPWKERQEVRNAIRS